MRRVIGAALTSAALLAGCSSAPAPDAQLTLTEMAIRGPSQLPAGTAVLEVTNAGAAHHNLSICRGDLGDCAGPDLEQRVLAKPDGMRDAASMPDATDALVLGDTWTAVVEVDLEPGRYRLWCAVPNHAAKGMERVVEVS